MRIRIPLGKGLNAQVQFISGSVYVPHICVDTYVALPNHNNHMPLEGSEV
jgi:hypothetical protein